MLLYTLLIFISGSILGFGVATALWTTADETGETFNICIAFSIVIGAVAVVLRG